MGCDHDAFVGFQPQCFHRLLINLWSGLVSLKQIRGKKHVPLHLVVFRLKVHHENQLVRTATKLHLLTASTKRRVDPLDNVALIVGM